MGRRRLTGPGRTRAGKKNGGLKRWRPGSFHDWKRRYGKVNEHNRLIPRVHWLLEEEKAEIVSCYLNHPDDGYRRVTYLMIDDLRPRVSSAGSVVLEGRREHAKEKE